MVFDFITLFEHKILFKKYLIEQRFGHFFIYQSTVNKSSASPPERTRPRNLFMTCHCWFVWVVSWRLIDTQHEKIIMTVTKRALFQTRTDLFYISFFFDMAPVLSSWLEYELSYSNGDKMLTQVFKKRIYEVQFKTYFVLEPSIETQNQIQVIYLNHICDWTVGARTLNIPSEDLFW